ncbi:MAG: glycosyltransferase, partial [Planctomycetota bacterium]
MPRQLRALHVIGDSEFGGGDIVVCSLLKLLQEHDIDVTLLATDPSAIEYAEGQGIKVWPFRGICRQIRPVRDLWAAARLAKAIRGRYDIVHTHTTKGGAIGRTAAWLARVPARLHHVHGFSFHEFTGKWTTRLMASAERKLGRMCDRLIFVNSFDREKAIEMGIIPAAKAVTVYNGLPEERLAPGRGVRREELLAELSLPDDAILSVNVGRLAPQKGLVYLF